MKISPLSGYHRWRERRRERQLGEVGDDPHAAAQRSTLRKNRHDAIDPHGKHDRWAD
jgi:hypothetical protein